jgi:hypothetical protein
MRTGVALAVLWLCAASAAAQEDDDLGRIPGAIGSAPATTAEQTSAAHGKYYVENAAGFTSFRGTFAVPLPYAHGSPWGDRTSFDAYDQWALAPGLQLTYSDRLSVTFADGVGFPEDAVRNELREAYVTWEPVDLLYLDAGRINVRNGVAYGFNPTDFFRSRTSVAQASADPLAQRENRLGTFMLRAQRVFDGGTLSFIYAPKLHAPAPIGQVADWIDPKIDQTNMDDRFLASLSFEVEEFSPQILVYHAAGRTKFGLNISHPVGGTVIAYASWAGGIAPNLTADAIAFGKRTGTLPPVVVAPDTRRAFRNEVSLGASWTGIANVTLVAEYNFNSAGFSNKDWRDWFDAGSADPMAGALSWYVRGYAGDIQTPASQHQAFVWASYWNAFDIQHLGLSGFVMANLQDGSGMAQASVSYDLSDRWSVGAYLSANAGGARTEWGSMSGAASAIVQVVRYL